MHLPAAGTMSVPAPEDPSRHFSRLSPEHAARLRAIKEPPKPTRGQRAVEIALFVVFGTLLTLAAIAMYTTSSPKHRLVPNLVDEGMKNDRINIVAFGIGGENHPSKDQLADSIMFISLKPSTKPVAMVSVPRDLWVKIGPYGTHRLNYAHAAGGQSGYPGEGPGLLCDTVSQVFQQPVHAFARIDFSAFEKIVDNLGGVDVNCQRGFYDYMFKDGFARGPHHLNGRRALAYARYRYVIGPEGDNFARELRQQQVVNALRDKMQRVNPATALKLVQAASTLSSSTETNLTTSQLLTLYRTFHDVKPQSIRHVSLKPVTETFDVTRLAEPGQAVRPRNGDWRPMQQIEATIFTSEQQISTEDQINLADNQ
jgi:LCP family protein required for cell wall assembly